MAGDTVGNRRRECWNAALSNSSVFLWRSRCSQMFSGFPVITGGVLSSQQCRSSGSISFLTAGHVDISHHCYHHIVPCPCLLGYQDAGPGPCAGDHLWCQCTIFWVSKSARWIFHLPHLNWIWHLFHQSHRTLVWFFTAGLQATLLYSCQKHLSEGRTLTGSLAEYIQPKELSAIQTAQEGLCT